MKDEIFSPLGDSAIVIDLGGDIELNKNHSLLVWKQVIEMKPFSGFLEAVPAYTTLTIFYDPIKVGGPFPYKKVKEEIKERLQTTHSLTTVHDQTIEIPVCYEEPFSPDLAFVAHSHHLTKSEVISIHSEQIYHVYFIGFAPGFPFLGGMNEAIATPRKNIPSLQISKGSVGIAGKQTGIYPFASPGGWQIIGRTPIDLFNISNDPPALLQPGNRVQFTPISKKEFHSLEGKSWR
ncbi:5-oxoprolinase subunit PxpB [Bacillus sp. FJAT-50079]|uniref:5-oxoprolinase subunit PxpB n=1 Tax=Bacillus sp. FJAT-50079 TaxID=2833577 RepID=UPI00201646AB|nr:5-oxoprolinase subunit PxpB [Bacillus sp. FJAT-50079]